MRFSSTGLPDVVLVEPDLHRDERGFFLETYHRRKYRDGGIDAEFVQDNHSGSVAGTVRGLHAQSRRPQGKLVRCVEGEIWDVAADVRHGSPTYARWVGVVLGAADHRQLWVPPGFVHGFCVLSEYAEVEYKCTSFYDPDDELSVRWNDPRLDIAWPVEDPVISEKDARAPLLAELEAAGSRLPVYESD